MTSKKPNDVYISPETRKSMAKFFMKTSVPKLVEELRKERKKETAK
ncbi:hypothetical protein H9649_07645 [Sporosarcina sp. Sa2YVA2]|uniref:Uncharacterized protein n=1 Tax=Sporosarcina quadrami TaxID=2762234 RepID=A0ABR8U9R4_9BACL|nr:hypothetical protein [Sporosarcina quadrami]MBD7984448.1 hypothetical protein [Sporosarcina quadrami]